MVQYLVKERMSLLDTCMFLCIACVGAHTQAGGLHSGGRVDSISKQTVSRHLGAHDSCHTWTWGEGSLCFTLLQEGASMKVKVQHIPQCNSTTGKEEYYWLLSDFFKRLQIQMKKNTKLHTHRYQHRLLWAVSVCVGVLTCRYEQ